MFKQVSMIKQKIFLIMQKTKSSIIKTTALLVLVIVFFETTSWDIFFQEYLYDFQNKQWLLHSNSIALDLFFYSGLKKALIAFAFIVLFTLLVFYKTSFVKEYKKGLMIIILSAILVPSAVIFLKRISNVPCPKNIEYFDGTYPNVTAFESYPKTFTQTSNILCWPAGHASGGFALLSLVFFFKSKKNQRKALIFALGIGWMMGFYKMALGDHFLSHTLITMILSWLIVLILNLFLTRILKEKHALTKTTV